MSKVAMIHATSKAVEPMTKAFQKIAPQINTVNFVNEEMLAAVNQRTFVGKKELRMFTKLIFEAMDSSVDCILVCCSIFCSYVSLMQNFTDVPIIAINTPMLERAASFNGPIGIISTTPTSAPHTQEQIEIIMGNSNRTANFIHEIIPEAMDALKKGNINTHNKIIADAIMRLEKAGCQCIVLSQITMAPAKDCVQNSSIPILTSPEEGVRFICDVLNITPSN